MKQVLRISAMAGAMALTLNACGGSGNDDTVATSNAPASSATTLSGVAATGAPLAGAKITVCDANGNSKTATTASDGSYSIDASNLTAPLLIAVTSAPFVTINGVPQPANGTIAYAALLDSVTSGAKNTANINQLTDKISSDVASTDLSLKGSVQLINLCKTTGIKTATIDSKTTELRALVVDALKAKGVANADAFDPVKTAMKADHTGVDAVLDMVSHNRDGWGSGTDDQLRGTKLYDRNLQELSSKNVKLDPALKTWANYGKRIFVVGDSTASNYGLDVAPRMGWGQVFERMLKTGVDAKVINLAQSGRSSRSFITEGWLKVLEDNVKSGDYVLIQWGHNDEKCGYVTTTNNTADKNYLDWVNRCTYPNDGSGNPQVAKTTTGLPVGVTANDLSFQKSLEKYIKVAKDKGAIPVLITPMTRINADSSVTTYVEGKFPISSSTHITKSGDYFGDYSKTILQTATANNVASVDLDAATISFMNSIGVGTGGADATGGWRDYYLAVSDFTKYPFYSAKTTTGHYLNADRTHFKEEGALKMANLIVDGIKADTTRLAGLIALLK